MSKQKSFPGGPDGMDTEGFNAGKDGDHLVVAMPNDKELKQSQSKADLFKSQQIKKESILRRIKEGTEGTIVLVGQLETLTQPAVALVRLAEGKN